MNQRARIICATDLLPRSDAAVERAGLLADSVGADLTLLHVVAPSESERVLEQALQQAQSMLRSRAQPPMWHGARLPNTAIRAGNPIRLVGDEAASGEGADLLVLGPHRRRPVRDVLEGTIAARVLSARTSAVLIAHTRPDGPYGRVLLALDTSPSSAGAIRAAEHLVLPDAAIATVVHAYDPPYQGMLNYANVSSQNIADYIKGWRGEVATSIRNIVQRESTDPSRFNVHVEAGHTVHGILRAVDRFTPDLLIMGTRGGGRVHRALLGSVANRVVRHVTCDVMVVPAGRFHPLGVQPNASSNRDSTADSLPIKWSGQAGV